MKLLLLIILLPAAKSVTVTPCTMDVFTGILSEFSIDDPSSVIPCAYSGFSGPIGTAMATLEPTKLSRYAEDHGKSMVDNMASFASFIPVVGSFLSFGLEKFSEFGFQGADGLINGIITEIEKQMDALKEYVDAKVQEHEYTLLSQNLIGIFKMAESCADYDQPSQIDDLERCLISFNTKIASWEGRFMPENDNIIAYELVLPFFRQYADMQLTVTQDLLRVAMKLKKKEAQKDYVARLKDQSQEFYDFSVKAVNRIVHVHTTFKGRTCSSGINWKNPKDPFSRSDGHYGECAQNFLRKVCLSRNIARNARDGPQGRAFALSKARKCVDDAASSYKSSLTTDLRNYWDMEIMKPANKWKKIAEKAESISIS